MHSSISMSLEPGLDRGVPWGHDLYTFVTSAAGHMMRTLQKPRKNRPSKRQVNHRRFLHNMIQRKFADIEAANHRLASELYLKVDEKKPDTPLQSDSAEGKNTVDGDVPLKDCFTIDSCDPEIGEKKQPRHLTTAQKQPKSNKNKQMLKKTEQNQFEFTSLGSTCIDTDQPVGFYGDENPGVTHFSGGTQADLSESTFFQDATVSPNFSPELSPLSLESCDLSVQMFSDVSLCTPAQKSFGELTESQWAEIINLFSTGSKEFRSSTNVEAYFESICDCHNDAEGKAGTEEELEDFFYERSQCRYDYSRDNYPVTNHFPVEHISDFSSSHNKNIIQNELSSSTNYEFMSYQRPLQQSQSTLEQYQVNAIQFEGVAQSFYAPSLNVPRCSIPTPPHEGDWLFTDILTDKTESLS